jgi:putative ABC transport system substrate-binding protein
VPNPFARRFIEKTKTIPIVASMADPVEYGLVTSLAHPGGNLTGVSGNPGNEMWGKRLQILKDAVPSALSVAYLIAGNAPSDAYLRSTRGLQTASEPLGISLKTISAAQPTDAAYREAFAATGPGSPDAIIVSDTAQIAPYRGLIAELATAHRVPVMFPFPDDVKRGALMAYGTDLTALGRQLAGQVAKILAGAKPGDIPIELASRFAFAINLKTAAAMGFTFPPAVIARADEVIE